MSRKTTILDEMTKKQIKNIDEDKMLSYRDMTRIVKNINTSIFAQNSCCIWTGFVTNVWNHKSTFINFYFKKKKVALHRLLYNNFVAPIADTEYIKYSCNNKGRCCNVLHFIKISKDDKDNDDEIINDENNNDDDDDSLENIQRIEQLDQSEFTLHFD
jgi:hypothetical protein